MEVFVRTVEVALFAHVQPVIVVPIVKSLHVPLDHVKTVARVLIMVQHIHVHVLQDIQVPTVK